MGLARRADCHPRADAGKFSSEAYARLHVYTYIYIISLLAQSAHAERGGLKEEEGNK